MESKVADIADGGGVLLVCDALKRSDLDLASTEDMREAARRVAASYRVNDKKTHKVLEQALGFTHQSYSMLCDVSLERCLRPSEQYLHDWMHGVFVGGVWNVTICLVLRDLWQDGVREM